MTWTIYPKFFFLNLCGIYSDCPRNNHSSGPGFSRSVTSVHIKVFLSLSFAHLVYMCSISSSLLVHCKVFKYINIMFLLSCGNNAPFILSLTQSCIMYKHSYLITYYIHVSIYKHTQQIQDFVYKKNKKQKSKKNRE